MVRDPGVKPPDASKTNSVPAGLCSHHWGPADAKVHGEATRRTVAVGSDTGRARGLRASGGRRPSSARPTKANGQRAGMGEKVDTKGARPEGAKAQSTCTTIVDPSSCTCSSDGSGARSSLHSASPSGLRRSNSWLRHTNSAGRLPSHSAPNQMLARKGVNCIPGYSGHIAGKVIGNVHGGTFASANARAAEAAEIAAVARRGTGQTRVCPMSFDGGPPRPLMRPQSAPALRTSGRPAGVRSGATQPPELAKPFSVPVPQGQVNLYNQCRDPTLWRLPVHPDFYAHARSQRISL